MDLIKLLNRCKYALLPEIEDWSLQYDDKRYRKDWHKQPNKEWFIFHVQAYKWTLMSICMGSFLMFTSVSILFYFRHNILFCVIFGLLGIRMGYATYKKLKSWKVINTVNFYDLLFREYYTK